MAKKSTETTETVATVEPKKILDKKHVIAKFRGFSTKRVNAELKKFVLRFSVEGQEEPLFLDKFYTTEADRNSVASLSTNKEYSIRYTEKAAISKTGEAMTTKDGKAIVNRTLWDLELSFAQKVKDADNF